MSEGVCSPDNQLLSFRARLGVFLTFEASLISAIAVAIVLCYTGYRIGRKMLARRAAKQRNSETELPQIDATDSLGFIVFMFWELIKALGGIMNVKWSLQGCITEDSFCTAQGNLRQLGDIGVSMLSLFIGFDTFFVLIYGWRAPSGINLGAIIALSLFTCVLVVIGAGVHHADKPSYMGSTIYWCWIRRKYLADQISLEYLWMWLTSLIQIILYGIMALVMRGYLVVEGAMLRPRPKGDALKKMEAQASVSDSDDEREIRATANLLLFYPAIHVVCILPLSIARWKYFANGEQTAASVLTTCGIFELSGFFNAILYAFARPDLVSGQNLERPSPPQQTAITVTDDGVLQKREREQARRRVPQGMLPDDDEVESGLYPSETGFIPATR